MSKKKYHVISPDGFPITPEPFVGETEARDAIPAWIERFKTQGYYRTSSWEKIPLEDLPEMLWIAEVDSDSKLDNFPTSECGNPSCPSRGSYH